jgi:hypothetical protein
MVRLPGDESEEFLIGWFDIGSASESYSRVKRDKLDGFTDLWVAGHMLRTVRPRKRGTKLATLEKQRTRDIKPAVIQIVEIAKTALVVGFTAEEKLRVRARLISISRQLNSYFSSLADATLLSGPITGQPADQSDLRKVREAITSVPVFANTGVSIDNVAEVLSLTDGVIIGTHFKIDGDTWNAVDVDRVRRFMHKVEALR